MLSGQIIQFKELWTSTVNIFPCLFNYRFSQDTLSLLWGNLQSEDESWKVFEIFQFKIELKYLHKINFSVKCEFEIIWDESRVYKIM